jgi:Fe-Mn family superoxide dismutase
MITAVLLPKYLARRTGRVVGTEVAPDVWFAAELVERRTTMNQMTGYGLPALGYAYDALEPIYSRETLELHHDKHHAAYVKGANQALADLAEARDNSHYHVINQLQKDLAFNLSGHILHSVFWLNMSPQGGGEPEGALATAIEAAFGDSRRLREQLTKAATSIQGCGWGALCYEPVGRKLIVEQIHDHQGNLGNAALPLLVLDMWEHAYYLQYRNDKQKWAKQFWDLVNWRDVGARFDSVASLDLRLVA